jgi:hypothetical protein
MGQEVTLLPAGIYHFQIERIEVRNERNPGDKEGKSRCPALRVILTVINKETEEAGQIEDKIYLNLKLGWRLDQLRESINEWLDSEEPNRWRFDEEAAVGKIGRLVLGHWEDKNKTKHNKVDRYLPYD